MAFADFELDRSIAPAISQFVESRFQDAIQDLTEMVAIPGIAWPAFDANNLELSAVSVVDRLKALEFFDWVEIRKAPKPSGELGAPAVIARRQGANGRPHVLLYAHHDVQPPGDSALWKTEPFVATKIGDRLFGRGASDDKSGIITHLYSIMALKELAQKVDVGITVFIEGEEEAGSESFENFLKENSEDLKADIIIVADSGNWTTETPALTTSLRGMVSQTFTVSTMDHAVHSGMFGGPLPDAMTAMIKLLASLSDDQGNVALEGLGSVAVDDLPYNESDFREQAGLLDGVQTIGSKGLLQQNWGEPAVTVIGIDAPSVALSSNTAQPSITARVSLRISPSEKPDHALQLLRQHLRDNAPFGAKVEFGHSEKGPGYLAKEGWASQIARLAFTEFWPNPAVNIGIGGSIPFISTFAELYPHAQILVTGVEEPDSRAHSPNESQHLPTLKRAICAQALLLLHGNSIS